jgi:hypothetical protein
VQAVSIFGEFLEQTGILLCKQLIAFGEQTILVGEVLVVDIVSGVEGLGGELNHNVYLLNLIIVKLSAIPSYLSFNTAKLPTFLLLGRSFLKELLSTP